MKYNFSQLGGMQDTQLEAFNRTEVCKTSLGSQGKEKEENPEGSFTPSAASLGELSVLH